MRKDAYTPEAYARRLAKNQEWRQQNREHLRAYDKRRNRERYLANPEKKHRDGIKSRYGLSACDYEKLLIEQENCCRICGSPPKSRRLAVDHCHKTGAIRGLLCASCNGKLAWFENRRQAIEDYLNG